MVSLVRPRLVGNVGLEALDRCDGAEGYRDRVHMRARAVVEASPGHKKMLLLVSIISLESEEHVGEHLRVIAQCKSVLRRVNIVQRLAAQLFCNAATNAINGCRRKRVWHLTAIWHLTAKAITAKDDGSKPRPRGEGKRRIRRDARRALA